jgi:hypothetical protein
VDRARAQPRVDRAHNRPSFRSPFDRVRRELKGAEMSYFPTPFGHLADWRVDPRDPRPDARARAQAGMALKKERKR